MPKGKSVVSKSRPLVLALSLLLTFMTLPSLANQSSPPICAPGQVSTSTVPCSPPPPPPAGSPGGTPIQYSLNSDPDVIDEARTHLRVNEPATGTHAMIYWDQNQINYRSLVSLETSGGYNRPRKTCSTVEDPECALTVEGYDLIYYNSVIGNCAATPEAMCVKEFLLIDESGNTIATGTPTKRIHQKSTGWKSTFDAKTNTGFPGSDEPWIWTLNGVEYIHLGLLESGYRKQNGAWAPNADKNLRFSFYPDQDQSRPEDQGWIYRNGMYRDGRGNLLSTGQIQREFAIQGDCSCPQQHHRMAQWAIG